MQKKGEKVKKNISETMMNPIRLRIIQHLAIYGKGTVSQIKEELCDIPPASLYRHIKTLCEAGCIEVVGEKQIRGTVERTYAMKQNLFKYADPMKDRISFSNANLLLSDEEFMELLTKIEEAITPYINNQPEESRKQRRFTLITSPCEKE